MDILPCLTLILTYLFQVFQIEAYEQTCYRTQSYYVGDSVIYHRVGFICYSGCCGSGSKGKCCSGSGSEIDSSYSYSSVTTSVTSAVNIGVIVGSVIGGLIFIAIVVVVVVIICKVTNNRPANTGRVIGNNQGANVSAHPQTYPQQPGNYYYNPSTPQHTGYTTAQLNPAPNSEQTGYPAAHLQSHPAHPPQMQVLPPPPEKHVDNTV